MFFYLFVFVVAVFCLFDGFLGNVSPSTSLIEEASFSGLFMILVSL